MQQMWYVFSIFIHRFNLLVFQWNELVAGFRSKIELRKYRRNYFTQTYEQCFTSSDAIQCLINVLKSHPNFETKQIEKFVRHCFLLIIFGLFQTSCHSFVREIL
jgi:hypothetical protein